MSALIFSTYLAARDSSLPKAVILDVAKRVSEGSLKSEEVLLEQLYGLLAHDLSTGEYRSISHEALSSAIQENIFSAEQFKALLETSDFDRWTYLGFEMYADNRTDDELIAFLGQALSVCPEALYLLDGVSRSGFHHLARTHPSLLMRYLPTDTGDALSVLKLKALNGSTVLGMFLSEGDADATKMLFERLNAGFEPDQIHDLFTSIEMPSNFAPVHWVAEKHPKMLPHLLRLLGPLAERALLLKIPPLNTLTRNSPEALVDLAQDIQSLVPRALLFPCEATQKTPLHCLATNPGHHQYFFPLLEVLGDLRGEALKIQDVDGITPLSQMAERLSFYKDSESKKRAAQLMLEKLTPDEWLIQDASALTPAHLFVCRVPDAHMKLLDHVGVRLADLLPIVVPTRALCGVGNMAQIYRLNKVDYSTQCFVDAMLAKNEAGFGAAIMNIKPETLTFNLRLRLMEKFVGLASGAVTSAESAGGVRLACEAMTAIASGQTHVESEFASHNTGVLAQLLEKLGLDVAQAPTATGAGVYVGAFRDAGVHAEERAVGGPGIEMTDLASPT